MKKALKIILLCSLLLCVFGCSSDPNKIDGKYVVNGYQTAHKDEAVYTWQELNNDQFYVVIEKAKIVKVYLNGSTFTGNFEGKGNSWNTVITWGSGNGPADVIFDGFNHYSTNIGVKDGELQLTFYLSLYSTGDWTERASIRFERVDE